MYNCSNCIVHLPVQCRKHQLCWLHCRSVTSHGWACWQRSHGVSTHRLPAALLPPVPSWTLLQVCSCPAEEVGEGEKEQLAEGEGDEVEGKSSSCYDHPQRTRQAPECPVACLQSWGLGAEWQRHPDELTPSSERRSRGLWGCSQLGGENRGVKWEWVRRRRERRAHQEKEWVGWRDWKEEKKRDWSWFHQLSSAIRCESGYTLFLGQVPLWISSVRFFLFCFVFFYKYLHSHRLW